MKNQSPNLRVFIDACILIPITSCSTLLKLAEATLFTPLWSQKAINEALRNLHEIHPNINSQSIFRRFAFMNHAFPGAMVSNWEYRTENFTLPDPDDHHVLLAALQGEADMILTDNLKDFPEEILCSFGIKAISLDDFLLDLLTSNPSTVMNVLQQQAADFQRPPITFPELLNALARCGAQRFAEQATKATQREKLLKEMIATGQADGLYDLEFDSDTVLKTAKKVRKEMAVEAAETKKSRDGK